MKSKYCNDLCLIHTTALIQVPDRTQIQGEFSGIR